MVPGSRKRASGASDDFNVNDERQLKRTRTNASRDSTALDASQGYAGKLDANGDRFWEISKMRRVTISSFRGKTLVSIREYYEKEGQELPGKKGISLPMDQFASLVTLLPDIELALEENGVSVPRPDYAGKGRLQEACDREPEDALDSTGPGDTRMSRENIEATSEENESDE
ncbi:putative RNA polymerase II transcriptional coactivator [Aspergillus avenaceus]|uniref:Putative RNA polymerase II transcriptional coactivator n=1 Tax=Aspergillus avenaceus TaxID=36643 RepID=A0A5N6TD87_ASPAV|nr:putative RNA polymerase II transcriptional coactivator [Aspergillus avenaceus]